MTPLEMIFDRLGHIEAKLDSAAEVAKAHIDADMIVHADFESRMRKIEKDYWKAAGVAGVITAIVTFGVTIVAGAYTGGG